MLATDIAHINPTDVIQRDTSTFDLHVESVNAKCILEEFFVTTPQTQFMLGSVDGKDTPLSFDPSCVKLFRGHLEGNPQSHVVLATYKEFARGAITHQNGTTTHLTHTPSEMKPPTRPPNIPMCNMVENPKRRTAHLGEPFIPTPPNQRYRLKQAVETDFEYRSLFESNEDALAYVVFCFGLISDIFERDAQTFVELTYVRIWETEDDLFNEPSPLGAFRNYWEKNMQEVDRNLAQFFSGRSNLPYGGVAWLDTINSSYGYSVVGYLMGFSGDINRPDVLNYDVHVAAHEIGHNCGTLHTHDYEIDDCFNLHSPPVRGPIMSYCSQSTSGGNACTDVRFHSYVQDVMDATMQIAHANHPTEFVLDCNGNGVDDAIDIKTMSSSDVNANGMPDECEDCNENGVLDDSDIANGVSQDVNANGYPDECEPDCNGNGLPDSYDIAQGTSEDIWGNNIPDECETDCDGDGQADYNQLMAEMELDLDRNLMLDSCEDCDGDGITDLEELDGAWFTWVGSSSTSGEVVAFHSIVGTRVLETEGSAVLTSWEVLITDDRRVLVTSPNHNNVLHYAPSGELIGELLQPSELLHPTGMVESPNGTLLVSSFKTNQVMEYDLMTGAFLGVFAEGEIFTASPLNLFVTSDEQLLVGLSDNTVIAFDANTGASLGTFVSASDNGGLSSPRGMAQLEDGDILVASMDTMQVLRFDGETGVFVGQFNNAGTETALTMDEPWGVRVAPDGDVYVSRHGAHDEGDGGGGHGLQDPEELHVNATRMYIFDGETGNFIRSYITGHDTELWQPTGFDFMNGDATDCNINGVADECDIIAGTSNDANGDGIPDECGDCVGDVTGDSVVNVSDVLAVIDQWGASDSYADANGDGTVNVSDILLMISAWGDC